MRGTTKIVHQAAFSWSRITFSPVPLQAKLIEHSVAALSQTNFVVHEHSAKQPVRLFDHSVEAAAKIFVASTNPQEEYLPLRMPVAIPFPCRFDELTRSTVNTPVTEALIVMIDGGDNASNRTLADVLVLAEQSDVVLYSLGIFEPARAGDRAGAK